MNGNYDIQDEFDELPPMPIQYPKHAISRQLKRKLETTPIVPIIIEAEAKKLSEVVRAVRDETTFQGRGSIFNLKAQMFRKIVLRDRVFIPSFTNLNHARVLSEQPGVRYISENRTLKTLAIAPKIMNRGRTSARFLAREDLVTTSEVKAALGVPSNDLAIGKGCRGFICDTGAARNGQYNIMTIQTMTTNRLTLAKTDSSGHGTHCTTIFAGNRLDLGNEMVLEGMAPGAEIGTIKCLFTPLGFGSDWSVVQALAMAKDNGATHINLSLGSESPSDPDSAQAQIIKELAGMGIIICAAAGNSGMDNKPNTVNSPGDLDEVITVASMSHKDNHERSFYSSIGGDVRKPDICIAKGTLIACNPKPIAIENIESDEKIYNISGVDKVLKKYENGVKDIYKLKTLHRTIKATKNHKFLALEKIQEDIAVQLTQHGLNKLKMLKETQGIEIFAKRIGYHPMSATRLLRGERGIYLNRLKKIGDFTPDYDYILTRQKKVNGKHTKRINYNYSLKWKELKNLKRNDLVVTQKRLPEGKCNVFENLELTADLCKLIGAFIGDGYLAGPELRICMPEGDKYRNKYLKILKKYGDVREGRWLYLKSRKMADMFDRMGLNKVCLKKTIPDWIFELTDDLKLAVIEGLIDADGCRLKKKNSISITLELANKQIIERFKELLQGVSIYTQNITSRERDNGHLKNCNKKKTKTYATGFTKNTRVLRTYSKSHIPAKARNLIPLGFELERIDQISYFGTEQVYDLAVENNHNYIANGFLVHNCGNGGGRASEDTEPDENILSSSAGTIAAMDAAAGGRLGAIKGTSQATPGVMGVLCGWSAIYHAKHGKYLTLAQVKQIFKENGSSWSKYIGYGLINYSWLKNWMR